MFPFLGRVFGPVEGGGGGDGDAEVDEVFLEAGEAFFVGVGAEEAALILHAGGEEGGFATGGGTGIEDGFSGFGSESFYGVSGSRVLNVDEALVDPFFGDGSIDDEEVGCVLVRGEEGMGAEFGGLGFEAVEAEGSG